jgi:predicted nucleic acid-binding protein
MGTSAVGQEVGQAGVITLDTSALIALADSSDRDHEAARDIVKAEPGPLIIPAGIMVEVTYMFESHLGRPSEEALLRDILDGVFLLDCGDRDIQRILALTGKYSDLPLGYADAAVVACAERRGGRLLSCDGRDFRVVAGEGKINVVPN